VQYELRLRFMLETPFSNSILFNFISLDSSKQSELAGKVQRQKSMSITTMA
jgi:hypothetical protein